MNKKLILVAGLFLTGGLHAYPTLNDECVNPNLSQQECTNDPLLTFSYEMDMMNFSYAWDKSFGTSRVAIVDTPLSINYFRNDFRNFRLHDSGQYACIGGIQSQNRDKHYVSGPLFCSGENFNSFDESLLNFEDDGLENNHGDLIFSLFNSKANDGIAMSSICPECSIAYYANLNKSQPEPDRSDFIAYANHQNNFNHYAYKAIHNATISGNQIINLSGFLAGSTRTISDTPPYYQGSIYPDCQSQSEMGHQQDLCATLDLISDRDIVFVASNGNDKFEESNWPANESDIVIGVAGVDHNGNIWQVSGSENPDCNDPTLYPKECGSQGLNTIDTAIAAPAKNVTVFHGNGTYSCPDITGYDPGYQICTGTSFSAPIISGLVSIMRSLNPLLSVSQIKHLLKNSGVNTDNQSRTYAIPKINQILKHKILGKVNGSPVLNRLKPMFRLSHEYSYGEDTHISYLLTSIPQLAVAALNGNYLSTVDEETGQLKSSYQYDSDFTANHAVGYSKFRQTNMDVLPENARAPFYIFGGHENPFTGTDDMVPLYHYAMQANQSNNPSCYDLSDHAYGTKEFSAFTNMAYIRCNTEDMRYVNEGIEGYLLPNCPEANGCYEHTGNDEAPQCLLLRFSATDNSYALIMESELSNSKFLTYTQKADHLMNMENAECLGYVYPNVDSDNDLIIDGMEAILGTDPNDPDTDDDGRLDGAEYPPTGPVVSDPLVHNPISMGTGS